MSSVFLRALNNTHLYPLTDRVISGLSHAAQVSVFSEAGAAIIQLREKTLSPREFFAEAAAALHVARERGVKIIINDRVDIALALKADGVHLGQDDISPEAARRLLGPDAMIGISTHNLEQAQLAANSPVDYVAIGPIFHTSTKDSPDAPVGLQGLSRVRRAIGNLPLVAIGGIDATNSRAVLDAGADALAVISNIWVPPGQEAQQIKSLLHSQ